jgi:hypothetical protein
MQTDTTIRVSKQSVPSNYDEIDVSIEGSLPQDVLRNFTGPIQTTDSI